MLELENTREEYFDIAKAIGIILVVMGHSDSPFREFIYLFHMALFFFISGYFYKDYYSENPILLIKKRLKTLYLPFIKYEIIYLLLNNAFFEINIYSDKIANGGTNGHLYSYGETLKHLIKILFFIGTEQLNGASWFFVCLFIVNVLFCFISYATKNYKCKNIKFQIVFFLYLIGNVASFYRIKNEYAFFTALVMLLIYYSGYIFKRNIVKVQFNGFFAVSSLVILLVNLLYGKIEASNNFYTSPPFFLVNSFSGIYLIIYISKKILKINVGIKLLEYIGQNTVIIMCLHFLAFKIINFAQVKIYNYPIYELAKTPVISGGSAWWMAYTFVGVFIPISIKYILEKLKQLASIKY